MSSSYICFTCYELSCSFELMLYAIILHVILHSTPFFIIFSLMLWYSFCVVVFSPSCFSTSVISTLLSVFPFSQLLIISALLASCSICFILISCFSLTKWILASSVLWLLELFGFARSGLSIYTSFVILLHIVIVLLFGGLHYLFYDLSLLYFASVDNLLLVQLYLLLPYYPENLLL